MLKILSVATLAAAGFAVTAIIPTAKAADLADVYKLAQQNDPQLQQAAAQREATLQYKGIARSGLLPQLSASAQYQKRKGDGSSSQFGVTQFENFTTTTDQTDKSWSIGLTQPLFHWDRWASLDQAGIQAAQAEVTYDIAKQDLIVRVAQAYFNVLGAEDTLQAGVANQRALGKQLQQAKKKYQVGLTAITDVQQFQAAFDQARATVIADQQNVTAARDALRVIVGVPVGDLREPEADMPLVPPTPNNAQQWIDMAIQQNLTLASTRMG
ncbi:MAG TPA: TolC family protein, partial [Gammaproteobacteria bacterium]|nr:TolC family protein [Gammaproteobacteria bacterium]